MHPRPWPVYESDAVAVCQRLLAEGRSYDYARGPEIAALEEAVASAHGRTCALAVNSGTSALFLAYLALGVQRGDEVLIPTFTFVATATPLLLLGARPVLVDAGDETGNVTASSLAAAITDRTVGLTVTHLFGHPCEMDAIMALARRKGLFVVEDCSHAHGSSERGRRVGTQGDVAIYSMGSRKTVTGGMGGMILTDHERVFDIACLASASKQRSSASVHDPALRQLSDVGLGGNLRMSPVAATLAMSHFERLEEIVAQKAANVERLLTALNALPGMRSPVRRPGCNLGGQFGVHMEYDAEAGPLARRELIDALQRMGAKVGGPQTEPMHRASFFATPTLAANLAHFSLSASAADPHGFPNASRLADRWLSLPADYLYGDASALVEDYVAAFTELLGE